jgi:hypothetical protein
MAEAMRKVHTCGRDLLRRQWWPVGPKLVFDQMPTPVPEIMDGSLHYNTFFLQLFLFPNKSYMDVNLLKTENCLYTFLFKFK